MDMPSWVTAFATAGAMIATVVLAYFAYLQIRREQHADERRRQATEMQISGLAFLLKLHLEPWISGLAEGDFDKVQQRDIATSRFLELQQLSTEAGDHVSKRIATAFVAFLNATSKLDKYRKGIDSSAWSALMEGAMQDLTKCVEALEDGPITRDLLDAHGNLRERFTGEPTNEEGVAGSQQSEGSE